MESVRMFINRDNFELLHTRLDIGLYKVESVELSQGRIACHAPLLDFAV
jgi:hypothetical protein